jgi:hypothetical protein
MHLASVLTAGRILFIFGIQKFIRQRSGQVNMNIPAPKIGAL